MFACLVNAINDNSPYGVTLQGDISICKFLSALQHSCICTIWNYYGAIPPKNSFARAVHSLTHWGRVTHTCVGKLTIIGSDNGLSPGRRQPIIRTNAGISLIGHLGTNFSDILIGIETFSFKKMHLKMSSAKWRQFCIGLNVLIVCWLSNVH